VTTLEVRDGQALRFVFNVSSNRSRCGLCVRVSKQPLPAD